MFKIRFDNTYIQCTYAELPRFYLYLKQAGYAPDEIVKRRINSVEYILTATKRKSI